MSFIEYQDKLPNGWFGSYQEHANVLFEELQKELPSGHLLYKQDVQVVAHREGTDDILCQHMNNPSHFTVIHLSWLGKKEINEQHPTVEVDGSFKDFLDYESAFGAV